MSTKSGSLESDGLIAPYSKTGSADGVTFRDVEADQQHRERWQSVIDKLLQWMREEALAGTNETLQASIASAIDFAVDHSSVVDQREEPLPVPTSVALADDEAVSFEWDLGDEITTIEIVASGLAELTRFRNHQVVEEIVYVRNPLTRKLERRGGPAHER